MIDIDELRSRMPSIYEIPFKDIPFKEYLGVVWIGDEPGFDFTLMARDSLEAYALAKEK